jgi:ADP-heptose:LPS heptosyltransferase/GT2 family glycosyltransferase
VGKGPTAAATPIPHTGSDDVTPAGMAAAPDTGAEKVLDGRRRNAASAAPDPGRSPPPQIQVDIDPGITAGYIHDRYDLLIRGRVVSSVPIEEAAMLVGDVVVGRVQYGQSDHVPEVGLADGSTGLQYVFHIHLPLRRAEVHRMRGCVVAVGTRDNDAYRQSFELAIDPANSMPVSVAAGTTRSSSTYARVRPPVVLYVERAVLDDSGQLQVHGWAVSLTTMVTVQVFADDELISAAQLGGQRHDVASAFPAYPNARMSGFALATRVDIPIEGVSTIRVQALSLNGFSHEAVLPVERVRALMPAVPTAAPTQAISQAPRPMQSPIVRQQPLYQVAAEFQLGLDLPSLLSSPTPGLPANRTLPANLGPPATPALAQDPRRQIRYYCDEMDLDGEGRLTVSGWAVCAIGISAITVQLDDEVVGEAELGLPRDDVGGEYRHIPMARYSGFRFSKALGDVRSGEHRLRVLLRNGLDDVREEIRVVVIERAEPPPMPSAHFRLEIDNPGVVAGAVAEPITGRLTIEGWALARSGIIGIDVLLDDQRLGEAHYGLARQDVGAAFPDWTDSLRSGYAFHCPPRSLRNGDHVVQLVVRARSGEVLEHRFRIVVRKSEEFEDGVTIRRRMSQVEADVSGQILDSLGHRPGFRLLLRQGSALDLERLLATLASLRTQVYRDWRLEIATADADTGSAVRLLIAEAADDLAERIDVIDPSDATAFDQPVGNPAETTTLRLVGFLSPGDQLGCDALLEIALASGLHRDADLIYGDEVRISPASREREAFFKPDFSPDLLLSTNYIGRPWFASTALFGRSGVTVRGLLEAGEYDAVLRCAEQAASIHHVPKLLCLRGTQQIDNAELEAAALAGAVKRRGISAKVEAGAVPGTWRVRRTQPVTGMVSIIIPTCAARGYIETCIKTLRERTAYRNIEIVCVDNIPDNHVAWKIWLQQNADVVVPMPDAFNWSHFNNRGVEAASGEYLLFLNDDIEVTQPDWLDAMLEHIQRPDVAVVGPQLLYPDNKVQHAGMFLATPGVARHAFRFAQSDEPGYFGLALTQRNVIAVTGACMLMRRTMYLTLGGFEEAHEIINNDLDFCLRAHQAGKLVVYTPYASLIHHEAVSRDRLKDVFDFSRFEQRWRTLFASGDPYFNPRLTRQSDDYRPDEEPVETVFAGHPLFRHDGIKRILVVKVDHIGDFITAIPAIRRLKQIFPAASIHVLASRAARAFAEIEDCIEEFIEFEFFHAISGLGPKQISRAEYQALRAQLAPYRFDIAVDLRKHLDTRDVLRYTPARFLAGYDYMGQFPFLDISLEWEGDRHLLRKRSHVTDDLINLVEAIGTAGASDRTRIDLAPGEGVPEFLQHDARALFARPVVAVHPGVGNVMRQWPPEHFASLIDLLVEQNAVNVVLIGGSEEAGLAEKVLGQVSNRDAVVSLVGKTPLRQLPALLRACALYVGNNSGPKHIAAALGVPTIGIHSGVVDAIEWGPIGKRAVAVRRNMTCSPCYIARPEDCPRNFACMRGLDPTLVQEVSEIFLGRAVGRRMQEALVELEPQVIVPSLVDAQQKGKRRRKATTSAPPNAAAPGVAAVADANDALAVEAPAGAVDPAPKARRRRSQSSSVPVE